MAFIDEIQLHISAGKGGDGVVRWRREKFRPKAGPGGGNGGRGGDVYAEAVADLAYLETYRNTKSFQAEHGEVGRSFGEEGANGKPLILKFPMGTVLTNKTTGRVISLDVIGQKELLLRGGRGGMGNEHFKSAHNTTPYESTKGKKGDSADFIIELQLIADIGLVGLPSAGKSTLLNALTHARSKVGAYHFTTLEPHLGVLPGGKVLADIPGLIEGASEGKGLGYKFLRHIRRTKIIAHVISLESENVVADYQTIYRELVKYDPDLVQKKELIVLSKSDLADEEKIKNVKKELIQVLRKDESDIFVVSSEDALMVKKLSQSLASFPN